MKNVFLIIFYALLISSCGVETNDFDDDNSPGISELSLNYYSEDATANTGNCFDQKRFADLDGTMLNQSIVRDPYEMRRFLQDKCKSGERLISYKLIHSSPIDDSYLVRGNFQCMSTICD